MCKNMQFTCCQRPLLRSDWSENAIDLMTEGRWRLHGYKGKLCSMKFKISLSGRYFVERTMLSDFLKWLFKCHVFVCFVFSTPFLNYSRNNIAVVYNNTYFVLWHHWAYSLFTDLTLYSLRPFRPFSFKQTWKIACPGPEKNGNEI